MKITQLGTIACFAFLMAGASRLARFNITSNPQPSNPGRPGKKYFVGMPIPAGAGVIAAVVHFFSGEPLVSWRTSVSWLLMVVVVGYLMVSTWRFYSFKDIDFRSRQPFRLIILIAVADRFASGIFRGPVLFVIAILLHGVGHSLAFAVDLPPQDAACTSALSRGISNSMILSPRPPASHADLRGANLYRVAIVGAASLTGKEVAEVLRDRNFPAVDIRLLDDDESLGQLEAVGDEMSFHSEHSRRPVRARGFHVLCCRSARDSALNGRRRAISAIPSSISQTPSKDEPGASVRSPWIERQIGQPVPPQLQPGPVVVAHPAAIVLALLALRAEKFAKIERMVATVFEPASEYGQKGMDELHEQTVNLLSFQDLPKKVFDVQVAFNMVARFGPEVGALTRRCFQTHSASTIATRIGSRRACAASRAGACIPRPRIFDLSRDGKASRDQRAFRRLGGRAHSR